MPVEIQPKDSRGYFMLPQLPEWPPTQYFLEGADHGKVF